MPGRHHISGVNATFLAFEATISGVGFDRYDLSGHTDIQQTDTDTDTLFKNVYQTDTDICFEIHIKPIPIPIIGIYLY